jgi:hypothetical protein
MIEGKWILDLYLGKHHPEAPRVLFKGTIWDSDNNKAVTTPLLVNS